MSEVQIGAEIAGGVLRRLAAFACIAAEAVFEENLRRFCAIPRTAFVFDGRFDGVVDFAQPATKFGILPAVTFVRRVRRSGGSRLSCH